MPKQYNLGWHVLLPVISYGKLFALWAPEPFNADLPNGGTRILGKPQTRA